eukprot:2508388-Rhodomonas_salina.3
MMCSKGIWCPNGFNGGDNCKFHCDNFGPTSDVWYDQEGCLDYVSDDNVDRRKLLAASGEQAEEEAPTLFTTFDWGHVIQEVTATGYAEKVRESKQ